MPVHADVISVLRKCGMLGAFAGAFAERHDINEINDFTFFEPEDADRLVNEYNKGTKADEHNTKIGALTSRKFSALLFWIKDKERRQVAVVANEWTAAQLKTSYEEMRSAKDRKEADEKSKPDVGKAKDGIEWFD